METINQKTIDFLSSKMATLNQTLLLQAKIDAIEIGVCLLIFTVLAIIFGKMLYKKHKAFDYEYGDFGDFLYENLPLSIITLVVLVGFIVLFFSGGSEIIDCIYNPQYYEIKNLLNH